MNKTINTKIANFKIGDTFIFHGAIFEVTGETQVFDEKIRLVYGRDCKCIKESGSEWMDSSLRRYNWMQGTEVVTYAKVI